MKIAHVVDSMELGGAEMLVSQMCRLQREQGHHPQVYAVAALGLLGEQLQSEGFVVQSNVGTHLWDTTRSFLRIFKQVRPDVVHLHNPTPTIYAAPAAHAAGIPMIVSTRHSLVAPPRNLVEESKYAVAACFCDWIVGICDATTDNVKSMHTIPKRKIVRVYNGVAPLSRVGRERWPPKNGFTLICVGRLEPVKNHSLLLNAFHAALSSMPILRLWIVGDGRERESLVKLVTDLGIGAEVTFWGRQLDVAPFLSAADAFIMSSQSEGLPMSLLEAFSLGLPAMVTDVGGMAEAVRLAQAGLTASATNPLELTNSILRLASNSAEREQFSMNSTQAFHKHFTLQTMFNAYQDLYKTKSRIRLSVGT